MTVWGSLLLCSCFLLVAANPLLEEGVVQEVQNAETEVDYLSDDPSSGDGADVLGIAALLEELFDDGTDSDDGIEPAKADEDFKDDDKAEDIAAGNKFVDVLMDHINADIKKRKDDPLTVNIYKSKRRNRPNRNRNRNRDRERNRDRKPNRERNRERNRNRDRARPNRERLQNRDRTRYWERKGNRNRFVNGSRFAGFGAGDNWPQNRRSQNHDRFWKGYGKWQEGRKRNTRPDSGDDNESFQERFEKWTQNREQNRNQNNRNPDTVRGEEEEDDNENKKDKKGTGVLMGLSTMRRVQDVKVRKRSRDGSVKVKAKFAVGPLTLEVTEEHGKGDNKQSYTAMAVAEEVTGKIDLIANSEQQLRVRRVKIKNPKPDQVTISGEFGGAKASKEEEDREKFMIGKYRAAAPDAVKVIKSIIEEAIQEVQGSKPTGIL